MNPLARRIRMLLTRLLALCAIAYAILCIGCASFQRRLIYFPPRCTPDEVNQYAASQNLERWLGPSGAPIGWKRLSPVQPAQGQVLVTHGNACCAFECANFTDAIQQIAPFDVFIMEYPGYENIPGSPSEHSLDEAADKAFNSLATNLPTYLVGESLGTGVAAYLAGNHSNAVAGVALFAPYNTLTAVAQAHMPLLPVSLMLADRFPSKKYLRAYHGPVAMLVAGEDNVVPEKFGKLLYDGYDGPKKLWEFSGENHGTVMLQPPEVWQQIITFWKLRAAPAQPAQSKSVGNAGLFACSNNR